MSQSSSYRELALHNQIIKLESELNALKTQQNYSTGDITSVPTNWITVASYIVDIPAQGGAPAGQVREMAATFTFTGSLKDRVAIGLIESKPSIDSQYNQLLWQFFMPTSSPNTLKFGVLYRMAGGGNVSVRLHTNMDGTFNLDKTYNVYLT